MIRLKDIAGLAGVSVMTVSKVLRDAPDISAATKARIRKLANEMGYMPDSLAQGLRNRSTKLFGLVISAATNPLFARMIVGLEERAHALGYDILLAQSLNLPEREEAVIRRLLCRRIDGLFLIPVYRIDTSAPIYEELVRQALPTVLLGPRAQFCGSFASVETDDLGGSYKLTQHLLSLGHRRIAFFAGPGMVPSNQERLEGHRRALREAQIEVDDRLLFHAGSTIEEGHKAALQLLQESPNVTAVQCVNDLVAIGAGNAFFQHGLQIPRDLSLAGFGNILMSEHFRVPLTTVRQPKLTLGMAAMESMLKVLRQEPVETLRLPAELLVRESTSAPPPPTSPSSLP